MSCALRQVRLASAGALTLLLAACAGPIPEGAAPVAAPAAGVAVQEPVQGIPPSAVPLPPPGPQVQEPPIAAVPVQSEPEKPQYQLLDRGMASWYGPGLHGRRTASGERFDRQGFTAAHRTLPFGTRVCVRSLATGKTVMVRINDRGPFGAGDRVVDLSQAAAKQLGMIGLGIKPVELWKVDDEAEDCGPVLDGADSVQANSNGVGNVGAALAPAASGTASLGLKASSLGLKRK